MSFQCGFSAGRTHSNSFLHCDWSFEMLWVCQIVGHLPKIAHSKCRPQTSKRSPPLLNLAASAESLKTYLLCQTMTQRLVYTQILWTFELGSLANQPNDLKHSIIFNSWRSSWGAGRPGRPGRPASMILCRCCSAASSELQKTLLRCTRGQEIPTWQNSLDDRALSVSILMRLIYLHRFAHSICVVWRYLQRCDMMWRLVLLKLISPTYRWRLQPGLHVLY